MFQPTQQQHTQCNPTSGPEGRVYANITSPWEVDRLFLIDPRLMEKHIKADTKESMTKHS